MQSSGGARRNLARFEHLWSGTAAAKRNKHAPVGALRASTTPALWSRVFPRNVKQKHQHFLRTAKMERICEVDFRQAVPRLQMCFSDCVTKKDDEGAATTLGRTLRK